MFYDLNLGVDGIGDQSRREMVAMAMQLGYSGVAANHTFTGVMADSDRCKLRQLELKTVLAAAPGIAESTKFHRELLGVPPGSPFRQFTRITVVVDNQAQANALNSGNPVLKTYDVVAVRPTNQKAFNQACSHLEVDLISLDVSQKLPFRLKMPVVKTAVQRGIYFELSYGQTIFDPKARRELFATGQMLLAATRGCNIIVSSGARRAGELRGPNDAANMSTLFGLTLESAKAAVSRNCKSVILHGVMRKATHRGAVHIEQALVTENSLHSKNLFNVPTDWDPLSLGGASADFIPMDDTTEVLLKEDPPSSNANSETKLKTQIRPLVEDVNTVLVSARAKPDKIFGGVNHSEMLQTKGSVERCEGDSMSVVSNQHSLQTDSARGLVFHSGFSNVREDLEPFVNARTESLGQLPVRSGGKQARRDDTKNGESSSLTSGQKKAKRRKKKR